MLTTPDQRERGFRLLMQQYGEQLYWHIRRIVVGHDDAEDVLQEASIKIFSSIQSFKGEGTLAGWMYRIATNEALRHLRRQTSIFQSIDALGPALTNRLEAIARNNSSKKPCSRCPPNSASPSTCVTMTN